MVEILASLRISFLANVGRAPDANQEVGGSSPSRVAKVVLMA